jgi:hypothetical protein
VESLKTSIKETGFWDNILSRKNMKGEIEIAYGHHRLQAIKELGIEEVDIPVKNIDDAMMIKIMANENMEDWKLTTSVLIETVSVAKEYLENQLAKYDRWEDIDPGEFTRIFENQHSFTQSKTHGIGRDIIKKFLGDNWKDHDIKHALTAIKGYKDQAIDKEAVQTFNEKRHATVFMEQLRNKKIPVEKQKEVAEKVINIITKKHDKNGLYTKENLDGFTFSGQDIREAMYEIKVDENKEDYPERFQKTHIEKKIEFAELLQEFINVERSIREIKELIKDVPYEFRDRFNMRITNIIRDLKIIKSTEMKEV